ncbi:MAG: phosphatidate cytidylyltransferase [Geminicoccaceae bacterium]|nr:phosphatidate cytidylyltransferase [Geminicoccaceae bacterium]
MADGDPALKLRVVSALALAPIALAMAVLGGFGFVLFVEFAVALMALEWARLSAARFGPRAGWIAGLTVFGVGACSTLLVGLDQALPALGLLVGGALIAAGLAAALHTPPLWIGLGVAYVGLPALAVIWLRAVPEHGLGVLIWLFLVVWAADSAAYFTGRTLGGPKLAPTISPSKTWSGFWGGVVGAALVSVAVAWFSEAAPLVVAGALAALLAVVSQIGDLAESALKRRAGVKDSGHLIPGHGGILDRVDGLLFAAPVLALIGAVVGPEAWLWR